MHGTITQTIVSYNITADHDSKYSFTSYSELNGHKRRFTLGSIDRRTPLVQTQKRKASLRIAGEAVIKLCSEAWNVCHFNALPQWLQDNDYLHMGHRPPLPSFWLCFKSMFRLHSETGNIWTHALGTLIFVSLFVNNMITYGEHHKLVDRIMLGIYLTGAITCLAFSTLFHTCGCHSRQVSKLCSKLDYCGISIQIMGSMIPAFYYGFYDNSFAYVTYIGMSVALCAISIFISLWDEFGEPKFRPLRTAVFAAFGMSNIIPIIHWFFVLETHLFVYLGYFILQGAIYVIGGLLYALRIPERFFPGKCDYWFQSHQIFHIMVVLAAIIHLNGLSGIAEARLVTFY